MDYPEHDHDDPSCSRRRPLEVTTFPATTATTSSNGDDGDQSDQDQRSDEPTRRNRREQWLPEATRSAQEQPSSPRRVPPDRSGTPNFIVIPPPPGDDVPQQQPQKSHSGSQLSDKAAGTTGDEGLAVTLQQRLFEHYHLVAYSLVIITYFLAFCEYLYLRLLSLVYADHPVVYRRHCDNRWLEPIQRHELHFASGLAVFLVMSVYQLCCFFLLTVSSRFMSIRRPFAHVLSAEQRLHAQLAYSVKRTMFATLYPTFGIYVLCSAVILCTILYMVGLRDQINVASRVLVYVFDFCVLLYFLAFPVLCVLFHPEIDCRARLARLCCGTRRQRRAQAVPGNKSMQTCSMSSEQQIAEQQPATTQATGSGTARTAPAAAADAAVAATPVAEIAVRDAPPQRATLSYGSLERRSAGGGPIVLRVADTAVAEQPQPSPRLGVSRRVRRQDRYRRLRDESATEAAAATTASAEDDDEASSAGSASRSSTASSCSSTINRTRPRVLDIRLEDDGRGSVRC